MDERDWAAEARERWPGCEAIHRMRTPFAAEALIVSIGAGSSYYAAFDGDEWCCSYGEYNEDGGHMSVEAPTPIAAIEAAIRAEQDEARATLARLAVWGVA